MNMTSCLKYINQLFEDEGTNHLKFKQTRKQTDLKGNVENALLNAKY